MKIKPLGDRVVVKVVELEEKTESGIVLPDTVKEKPQYGEVIAVGSGRVLDNGEKLPLEINTGDKVLYSKFAGTEFKKGNEELLILSEKDILGIIED